MTEDIRQFVVESYDWEVLVEVDISKYSNLEKPVANRRIREEVVAKGIEWFKNQQEKISLSVNVGVYEKVDYNSVKNGVLPQTKILLDRDSKFVKTKKDTYLGRPTSYKITNESLQKEKQTEKPHEIWPY